MMHETLPIGCEVDATMETAVTNATTTPIPPEQPIETATNPPTTNETAPEPIPSTTPEGPGPTTHEGDVAMGGAAATGPPAQGATQDNPDEELIDYDDPNAPTEAPMEE